MILLPSIQRLAVKALYGSKLIQPATAKPATRRKPSPEEIGAARSVLQNFAARLRELHQARKDFDQAVNQEREVGMIDLATKVARGEPLPDISDITNQRQRAQTRLTALHTLATREAEGAARAGNVVKTSCLEYAVEARETAVKWVADQLPEGCFTSPQAVAESSEPVFQANRAIESAAGAPTVKIQANDLFGFKLPSYRITELPLAKDCGVVVLDVFDPIRQVREIERLLSLHGEAIRFRWSVGSDPLTAVWEG